MVSEDKMTYGTERAYVECTQVDKGLLFLEEGGDVLVHSSGRILDIGWRPDVNASVGGKEAKYHGELALDLRSGDIGRVTYVIKKESDLRHFAKVSGLSGKSSWIADKASSPRYLVRDIDVYLSESRMQICGVAFGEVPVEEFGRLGVNLVERERLTTAVNE